MATSRRRERDLARRRYERRRQAEVERRARAKRRNTVLGAAGGTGIVIVVLLILTFTVFTGGSGKKSTVKPGATPSTSTSPVAAAPTKCAAISPNPTKKGQPYIPPVKGKPPTTLVTKDLTVGHGPAAKAGATVNVYYTGISCDTGKVFDASYLHPPLATFPVSPLGTASVIPGWNQGLMGVKAGGVRELVIPASLGYGAQGQPSAGIEPNDTLIFLVQVKSVKNK